ncbi:MAG: hypothetical protein AUH43_04910 [Acidobacteria bacterium 13_1_40CM_65_14]|jgi:putative redox protein|nr:MAG: hypothetical protein AUH43_04910 [Acidobacteria bacterium 13_1_40CM_65_14]
MPGKPPTVANLTWIGDLKFAAAFPKHVHEATRGEGDAAERVAGAGAPGVILDSTRVAGPSPVDALAAALAGCMTTDVTDIIIKGRHPLRSIRSHLVAERADTDPHRFLRVTLHFTIDGAVPAHAVEHAIALSRDKYCSVWHSMRQDIAFTVTFDVTA